MCQSSNWTKKIGFIGCGHMANAIIKGLSQGGLDSNLIYVTSRTRESCEKAIALGAGHIADNIPQLIQSCDVIFLAVKPQSLDEVLNTIRKVDMKVLAEKLFVSIAAGKTCQQIVSSLNPNQDMLGKIRVMRVMPNLPVEVGHLAGAYCVGNEVKTSEAEMISQLFQSVGHLEPMSEHCMEAVTALCGSGPAFVFMFLEALADSAVHEGLDRQVANHLALEMLYGAAKLAKQSSLHFAQLRNRVESPGGTTIYGTCALENGQFRKAVMNAIQTAVQRAKQLST
eukprot:jgi/Galph1/3136/GphlegSOOS_G1784.1